MDLLLHKLRAALGVIGCPSLGSVEFEIFECEPVILYEAYLSLPTYLDSFPDWPF